MGTDIHIYAERFDGTDWSKLPIDVPRTRNYRAFALLADVRNGVGFAGCITGARIEPIASPRGIPSDTSIRDESDEEHDESDYVWLGDHSFSWVLLSELRALDLSGPSTVIGMISPEQAFALDERGELPTSWCGGTTDSTWVRRSWQRPLREDAHLIANILEAFKNESLPERVRFVFGFDS